MAQQPPVPPPPPPATPPPPGQYGPGYGPPMGARPGSVTFAAVLLIIVGSLYALFGVLVAVGGGAAADVIGGLAGAAIAIGLLVLAFGVLEIVSGAKILGLSSTWRVVGIVLSAIGTLFGLLGLIGSFGGQEEVQFDPQTFEVTTVSAGPNIGGIVIGLLFVAAQVTVIVLLARNSRSFVR